MKHTKGKWEVDEIRGCKVVVCGSMVIASDLFDENEEPSIEELDANANLIASAPELLEEIKDVQKWILDFRNNVSIENAIKISNRSIRITELITKAEGQG
mgnify:CR=1 FL=1